VDIARIVIVGGGQAAGWAAKTLRDQGYAGALALVGDEPHPPYERPPLSKAVLAGTAAAPQTHLFKGDLLAGLRLDWRRGRRALRLDRGTRTIVLDDGEVLSFDRLLIATGGRARPLPLDTVVPIHTLRSLDDAQALRARLQPGARVLVIGGGWIGLEVAATACAAGLTAHVVESAARLCARVLPPELSARLHALHLRHGVGFSLGTEVRDLSPRNGAVRATLRDGTHLDADVVVAGTGMLANDELARDAGLACAEGILVDARCATFDPAIFAAGDVARVQTRWAADPLRLESWQNAQDQGIAAAKAMLGHDIRYDPVPRFWSDQHGVNLQIVGLPALGDTLVLRGHLDQGPGLAFALRDGVVRAAVGFNAGREMRPARNLVEKGAVVDPARLADATVPLASVETAGR